MINRSIWAVILCCILANTGSAAATALDFNGDGRSDFVVVRNTGGGSSGQVTWFTKLSGGNPTSSRNWGVASDIFLAADFDGDAKCDITVWRPSNGTFYIVESNTFTIRIDQLGQNGDDPTIVGDYNADGKADVAVFRAGDPGRWFYKTSPSAYFTTVNWGEPGDIVAPGDYDGDGAADFVTYRPTQGTWYKRLTTQGFGTEFFSFPGSFFKIVPGDYDGDGKTDLSFHGLTLIGSTDWHYEPSGTPGTTRVFFFGANGIPVQGDYTGDGKTDYALWHPETGTFQVVESGTSNTYTDEWGDPGDVPVGAFNSH